jgi:hypothetical protein
LLIWRKSGRSKGKLWQSISSASGKSRIDLFDPNFRKGGGRVGILGTGEADQGSGLPIGVQFFGALGAEIDIILAAPPRIVPG